MTPAAAPLADPALRVLPRPGALAPDPAVIQDWLTFWFHHATRGVIQIGWRVHDGPLTHFLNLPIGGDDLGDQIAEINAREGHSVYFRPSAVLPAGAGTDRNAAARAASDTDFAQGLGVWGDLDDAGAAARRAEIDEALGPCAWVQTGCHPHWRGQMFWRFDDPCERPDVIRSLNTRICAAVSGDASVTNPTRLMRIPGCIAWPAKPGRVPELTRLIIPEHARREWCVHALGALVPPVRDAAPPKPNGDAEAPIQDIAAALAAMPNGDLSWEDWSRIGMAAFRASAGSPDALAAWKAWSAKSPKHSDAACDERWRHWFRSPPTMLGFGTLHHHATKANPLWQPPSRRPAMLGHGAALAAPTAQGEPWEGRAAAMPQRPALWRSAALPADDIAIPARPWIVPGYLMRGAVTVLSGAGGAGKSSLAVAWTTALAAGRAIGRFAPSKPEQVVFWNVEDDRDEQHRRYSAALLAQRVPREALADRATIAGPEDIGTLFIRDPASGRIGATPALEALRGLVQEAGASVLVADPLAELHNAEENDNTAMRSVVAAFRSLARDLDIAVLLLHHNRKGAQEAGSADMIRGAGAISAAVRVALTLTTMTQQEADGLGVKAEERRAHFRLDGAKSNYAVLADAEWWRLAPVTIPNGEHIAACRPWSPPSPMAKLTMADCVAILDEIAEGQADGFRWQRDPRAGDGWAGSLLLRAGLTEGQAKAALRAWEREGVLTWGKAPTRQRKDRECFAVVPEKLAAMRSGAVVTPWEGDE